MSAPANISSWMLRRGAFGRGALAAAILLVLTPCASAQNANKGVPNALQGFSENRSQPIEIEAGRLEVRDKQKVATFSGNVKVVQGEIGRAHV